MRRLFLSILLNIILLGFFVSIFYFEKSNKKTVYDGNSWGSVYYLNQDSDFYINELSNYSSYRIKKGNYIYCSSMNKYSNKKFCWYIFDEDEMPIFGWVKIKDLEKK